MRISAYTLKWYERQLTGFLRIRKDVMINPACVCAIESISNRPRRMRVVLTNGEQIEVTRRRQTLVRSQLRQTDENPVSLRHDFRTTNTP